MKAIRRTNDQLNSLLRKQSKKSGPAAEKLEKQLKETINRFLDFEELARRSLAKHWEKRSAAEQREFVGILRELIERNYLKQLRGNLEYEVVYREEKVNGETARVLTAVQVKGEGRRAEEVEIAYKMRKTKSGWMVFDVITDEVSIVNNYRSQFNRIINQQSYEALVNKMRRKLETLKSST